MVPVTRIGDHAWKLGNQDRAQLDGGDFFFTMGFLGEEKESKTRKVGPQKCSLVSDPALTRPSSRHLHLQLASVSNLISALDSVIYAFKFETGRRAGFPFD